MSKRTIKELIEKHKKILEELEKMSSNKEKVKETTIEEVVEKQIKKRIDESDAMFKYFGRF